jgi:hypothetical protein
VLIGRHANWESGRSREAAYDRPVNTDPDGEEHDDGQDDEDDGPGSATFSIEPIGDA